MLIIARFILILITLSFKFIRIQNRMRIIEIADFNLFNFCAAILIKLISSFFNIRFFLSINNLDFWKLWCYDISINNICVLILFRSFFFTSQVLIFRSFILIAAVINNIVDFYWVDQQFTIWCWGYILIVLNCKTWFENYENWKYFNHICC